MRARYYHPGLGRFISQDPIGFLGGTNLYAYCGNDPINFTDPLGLAPNDSLLAAAGALYGAGEMGAAAVDPMSMPNMWFGIGLHAYQCGLGKTVGSIINQIRSSFDFMESVDNGDPFEFGRRFMNAGLTAYTLGRGAVSGTRAVRAARASGCATTPWQTIKAFFGFQKCFVAGTPVLMADGSSKAIENVKAGDLVLSKDEKTGEIVKQKVVNTTVRTADATLVVEVAGGGRVETTAEHPFYVEGKGWTPAGQLAIGNAIVTRAGPSVKVTRIEKKEKPATVYNFEVADTHSYFVGHVGRWLWVHNQCRARFEVTPDGTAIPTSRAELEQGFINAGFSSSATNRTAEVGTIYIDPKNGNLYRVMQGAGPHGPRLMTHAPGGNPLLPSGANLPGNLGKVAIRNLTHFPLEP